VKFIPTTSTLKNPLPDPAASHPFIQSLGENYEDIMCYCLGEHWRATSLKESLNWFNKRLGITISETTNVLETSQIIKSRYEWLLCYHRYREVLIEKTHNILR